MCGATSPEKTISPGADWSLLVATGRFLDLCGQSLTCFAADNERIIGRESGVSRHNAATLQPEKIYSPHRIAINVSKGIQSAFEPDRITLQIPPRYVLE